MGSLRTSTVSPANYRRSSSHTVDNDPDHKTLKGRLDEYLLESYPEATEKHHPDKALLKRLRKVFGQMALLPAISITDALQARHPNAHIARTPASTGLTSYAKAGHAQQELDDTFPFYGTHVPDLDEGRKSGSDTWRQPNVARYTYRWRNHGYLVYTFRYYVGGYEEEVHEHYIVANTHPRDTNHGSEPSPTGLKRVDNIEAEVDSLILAASSHDNDSAPNEIHVYDRGYWRKSNRLWKNVQASTWDSLILDTGLKRMMRTDIEGFFSREASYTRFTVPWKRGIIFHGIPGNGKTMSIKTIMNSLSKRSPAIPTLYVKALGKTADADDIRGIFEKARECKPCLLVFEDLDSLISDSIRSFFLNEIDGLEGNDGILMIGSTNYLDRLDPGISKRPSRFDRKFHFSLPGRRERSAYCESWREKLRQASSIGLPEGLEDRVAGITEGFSFAYLQEMWISALMEIVARQDAGAPSPTQERGAKTESQSDGGASKADDVADTAGAFTSIDGNELWDVLHWQVKTLRKEMHDGKKSVEDAVKNSATGDARPSDVKATGFGL